MRLKISEKGQALVEFAIILPILLLLLGPMIDLGRAIYTKTQLQNITSDLLHMTILENEYSYQGGSFRAIEDSVIEEDLISESYKQYIKGLLMDYYGDEEAQREIQEMYQDKKDQHIGYLSESIFNKFIQTDGLVNLDDKEKYVKISDKKESFKHNAKYPKLSKYVRNGSEKITLEEYMLLNEKEIYSYQENGYKHDGIDVAGYDREGYIKKIEEDPYDVYERDKIRWRDIDGYLAGTKRAEDNKVNRWQLRGVEEVVGNKTYYRTVEVTIPYEVKNITFLGKVLFGESRKIIASSSGLIYEGGDGRDVKDY